MNAMKRILLVHPQFQVVGGAEQVALRIMHCLLGFSEVQLTVLTTQETPARRLFELINVNFDPSIDRRLATICIPHSFQRFAAGSFSLGLACLHRFARTIAGRYDHCVSTYNEIDFGRSGYQYIHHPTYLARSVQAKYHLLPTRRALDFLPGVDVAAMGLVRTVSGATLHGFSMNRTAVNSDFMKGVISDAYGIEGKVLYPSTVPQAMIKKRSWTGRTERFISIGRVSPDKKITTVIDLFAQLAKYRRKATFVHVGRSADQDYAKQVLKHARELELPFKLLCDVTDREVFDLLCSSTCFVSAKEYEHFGIASLQAGAAGALPFVHDSGGQREVICREELRYNSPEDLAEKVSRLLEDEVLREGVRGDLISHLKGFSVEAFSQGLKQFFGGIELN